MENIMDNKGNMIEYEFIEKPGIKNTYFRFKDDKLVVISSSRKLMKKALNLHMRWVSKHYGQIKNSLRLFDSGRIFCNSNEYLINYVESNSRPAIDIREEQMIIYAKNLNAANRHLEKKIRTDSMRLVSEMAMKKAAALDTKFAEIKVRKCRKWGACRSNGTITINFCISMLPEELRDYIISHEIAHLKEMNHSKKFWSVVELLCPDYKRLKKDLGRYDNSYRNVVVAAT
jgi:predicted metal-dependent hydrolase